MYHKYDLGDEVFAICKERIPVSKNDCCYCKGHGVLKNLDDEKIICSRCYGRGFFEKTEPRYIVKKSEISGVYFDCGIIYYYLEDSIEKDCDGEIGNNFSEDDLFDDFEEAQRECNIKNTDAVISTAF